MTLIDLVRLLWLAAGVIALVFAVRKLTKARADHAAHVREGGNGSVLHAGRWRIRAAWHAVSIAAALTVAAALAVLDWLIPGPSVLGLWTLITLTLVPVLFAWTQIDDDRNHQSLLDLITTEPARQRRKMDEHVVTERVDEP
jgi:hypothetical protein